MNVARLKTVLLATLFGFNGIACHGLFGEPTSNLDMPEMVAPRDPARNPLISHVPLAGQDGPSRFTCGGAPLEPEKLQVDATAEQLCVTKIKIIGVGIDDRLPTVKELRDGNAWRLTSGAQKTAVFELVPEGAPKEHGWCSEALPATDFEMRTGQAQVTPSGQLVKMRPARVFVYSLKGCVPNNGTLTAQSTELALRIKGRLSENDLVAWGFTDAAPSASSAPVSAPSASASSAPASASASPPPAPSAASPRSAKKKAH